MRINKPVSLKDLAVELDVSISTVSRALRDSPEISVEVRERVKALARKYNYRPNPFAMSLLKNSPRIIGILVPDLVTHFYASIISGINDVAKQNGYSVIITSSYEQYELEKQCLDDLINIRVEGIIACLSQETTDYTHFEALESQNVPLVFFDRICPGGHFCSVVADNVESAHLATEHLLQTGSTRIGFIGGANHLKIVGERKHGYLEALRQSKIPIEKELVICEKMSYDEGREATRRLLSLANPPDAILAMNDTLAFAAMKEIKGHQLKIPQDIALVGYTDEMHSNYVDPPLTAVTHQTYKMGAAACKQLLGQIKEQQAPYQIIIPTHLVIRESSSKK
ncbi:LacI family DNA-binding transcriptional regulator [uncultured Bacteroides sp.]|uniref:LacI family DNA-binding transcriptional regulator n=1 Tax=uncultured Bacteroides sp. TaxID=162156 RepID=UPI002AAB768E|nr:LacI family DNA-binding transcriptional regulator [uncultured Bacteroides sp.]